MQLLTSVLFIAFANISPMSTLCLPSYIHSLYNTCCFRKQKDSRGPSFETISASGPNAALAHYRYAVCVSSTVLTHQCVNVRCGGATKTPK